ncbi:hypothetical protein LB523_08855 [Mesorhizobium sp. ESP-6-4]|nr:hypothetical protein [Mesorhizobium sp. ESP-6-4]
MLETRESRRADRLPGLARWQFERVHRGVAYDLELDTSRLMPSECARLIQQRFNCSDLHSLRWLDLPVVNNADSQLLILRGESACQGGGG